MADATFTLNFRTLAEMTGLNRLAAGLQETKGKVEQTTKAAGDLRTALLGGFAGGIAASGIQQLTASLSQLPGKLAAATQSFVADGVRFNATLESSRLGIASIIKQFDQTGKIKDFDAAMQASAKTVAVLREKAVQTSATFDELLQGFQANAGPLFQTGINNARQQVEVVVAASQAMAALSIPTNQLNQELRAIFQGDTSRNSRLNQVLRITKDEIEAATSSGTAYSLLMQKLGAFSEGAARGQRTYTTALSNMEDALTALKAEAAEPIFASLTEGLLKFNEAISSIEARAAARTLGTDLVSLLGITQSVGRALDQAASSLERFAGGTGQSALKNLAQTLADRFTGAGFSAVFIDPQIETLRAQRDQIRTEELTKQVDALYEQAAAQKTVAETEKVRADAETLLAKIGEQVSAGYYKDSTYATALAALLRNDLVVNTEKWAVAAEKVAGNFEKAHEQAALFVAGLSAVGDVASQAEVLTLRNAGNVAAADELEIETKISKQRDELLRKYPEQQDAINIATDALHEQLLTEKEIARQKKDGSSGGRADKAAGTDAITQAKSASLPRNRLTAANSNSPSSSRNAA